MSEILRRTKHALPFSFLVFAGRSVLALAPALVLASRLAGPTSMHPDGTGLLYARGGHALAQIASGLFWELRGTLIAAAVAGSVAMILAPWLFLGWVRALDDGSRTVGTSLRVSPLQYVRALVVSFVLCVPAVLGVVGALAGMIAVGMGISIANESLRALAVCAATLPGLTILSVTYAWHDAARAHLAVRERGPFAALASGFRAISARSVLLCLAILAACALLAMGSELLMAYVDGATIARAGLCMLLAQSVLFARVWLRSLWLARVVRDLERDRQVTREE